MGFKTGEGLLATDLNGDQIDDIIISSPHAFSKTGENGWIHAVFGGSDLAANYDLTTDADMTILAPEASPTPADPLSSGQMGMTLIAGDFNGDGQPDLMTGAPKGLGNLSGTKTSCGWVAFFSDPANKGDLPAGTSGECLVFGEDMSLRLPSLDVLGSFVGITLQYEGDVSFRFDLSSLDAADPLYTPVALSPSDLSIDVPCAEITGLGRIAFRLRPADETFMLWGLDLTSVSILE